VQVTGKVRADDKGTNQVDVVIEGFGAASLPIPMKAPLCSEMIAPPDSGMISPP